MLACIISQEPFQKQISCLMKIDMRSCLRASQILISGLNLLKRVSFCFKECTPMMSLHKHIP